jgi:hypothetical protein
MVISKAMAIYHEQHQDITDESATLRLVVEEMNEMFGFSVTGHLRKNKYFDNENEDRTAYTKRWSPIVFEALKDAYEEYYLEKVCADKSKKNT